MNGSGGLLLSFLGDDFTGSTDVMEALTAAGVRTVLFLDTPAEALLAKFDGLQAVGVAVMSRSMSPAQIDAVLPPALAQCRALRTPIVHYKVCSTFDSSPEVGCIGRAMELGSRAFGSRFVPLVVGAPVLGRFCVFGNLFARSGLDSEPYRLDRHPTMRCHPTTPMSESDLRIHLGAQTCMRIGLLDVLMLEKPVPEAEHSLEELLAAGVDAVLFDLLYERHLPTIGRLIWGYADHQKPLFAVGSSGLEYALTAYWRTMGLLGEPTRFPAIAPMDRMVVVSGSCSPVTDQQIGRALQAGFAEVPLDTERLVEPGQADGAADAAVRAAGEWLSRGRSVVLHTSRGPEDRRLAATVEQFQRQGFDRLRMRLESGKILGAVLGRILRRLLERTGVRRVVVAGGDTSGAVARELGLKALEMIGPTAPGAPLCRAHARSRSVDGLQIVFKGGQVGRDDFLTCVLNGRPHVQPPYLRKEASA